MIGFLSLDALSLCLAYYCMSCCLKLFNVVLNFLWCGSLGSGALSLNSLVKKLLAVLAPTFLFFFITY
jgi:hypothetical protein